MPALRPSRRTKQDSRRPAPSPVDIHDGIPDRTAAPSRRRRIVVGILLAVWVALLLYFLLAGRPR